MNTANGKSPGIWAGGEAYKLCPAVCLERYGATLDRIHALGFHGCAYLDAQTTGLFRCSHPKHPADEREFALSLCRILEYVRRLYGASSSENCASYALPYCDEAANLGRSGVEQFRSRLDDGFNRLVSRIVPFYNVAVHGLVIYRSCWSSRTGLFGLYENLGNDWFEFEIHAGRARLRLPRRAGRRRSERAHPARTARPGRQFCRGVQGK
ncbi:MAG: hypothetical protein V8T86_03245 [Victivallis sp.]